jgi:hypothetical protein
MLDQRNHDMGCGNVDIHGVAGSGRGRCDVPL